MTPFLWPQTPHPLAAHPLPPPPTHTQIDDGLELRKAAFECMDILLDTCRDNLATATFIGGYALQPTGQPRGPPLLGMRQARTPHNVLLKYALLGIL